VGGVTHTERLVFAGDRHAVREQTVLHSLNRLLRYVEEI
jgi:nicotinamide-nucleotide amidase